MYATRSTQPVHDLTGFALLAETALMFGSLHKTEGKLMHTKSAQEVREEQRLKDMAIGQILARITYKLGLNLVKKGIMTQDEFLQILYDAKISVGKEVINHDTIN